MAALDIFFLFPSLTWYLVGAWVFVLLSPFLVWRFPALLLACSLFSLLVSYPPGPLWDFCGSFSLNQLLDPLFVTPGLRLYPPDITVNILQILRLTVSYYIILLSCYMLYVSYRWMQIRAAPPVSLILGSKNYPQLWVHENYKNYYFGDKTGFFWHWQYFGYILYMILYDDMIWLYYIISYNILYVLSCCMLYAVCIKSQMNANHQSCGL